MIICLPSRENSPTRTTPRPAESRTLKSSMTDLLRSSARGRTCSIMSVLARLLEACQQSRTLRADCWRVSDTQGAGKVPAPSGKNQMEVYRSEWRQQWGLDKAARLDGRLLV